MFTLLITMLLAAGPVEATPPAPVHNFHVGYANIAVEGQQAISRVRFFADDLEVALQAYTGEARFQLEASPETEAVFLRYLAEHFQLTADGERLTGVILQSGEETMGSERMWWYVLQYEAASPIEAVSLRNTMLFDAFDDQKNIVKIQHFPSERKQTLYFAEGAETYAFSL